MAVRTGASQGSIKGMSRARPTDAGVRTVATAGRHRGRSDQRDQFHRERRRQAGGSRRDSVGDGGDDSG